MISEGNIVSWDQELDDFFRQLVPDLSGDIPFICLDIIECLDRAYYSDMTPDKVAKVIGRPKMIVDKIMHYLGNMKVLRVESATGIYKLDETNKLLDKFLLLYKTPSGRLKVIEKILGF